MHTLGMKPLLKVTFCVIIAWEIPSDVKKVFVIVGLVLVANMAVVTTDQQFADTRLSKIAQIALTLWLQEKIIYILNMKETFFEVFI